MSHRSWADGPMPFAEPGVGRHYGPDRTVRITSAHVRLRVHPVDQWFEGEARFELQEFASYRGRLGLDLDEVDVLAVEDGEGRPLEYRFGGGTLDVFAASAPPTVVVRWRGSKPTRGLYFTAPTQHQPDRAPMAWTQCQDEDAHFCFPCHDHPGSKHPWVLELEAPPGYTLLSNGALEAEGVRDGFSWVRYRVADPMPAYLVSFVAAKLTTFDGGMVRDIPIRYLVPVGQEAETLRAFGRTPDMIRAFEAATGVAYPWPRYDQVVVHDFVFGGMENVACTTMTDVLLVDARGAVEWDPDGLVCHELAHQWFGDLVTCQDWSQGWLNESWATYMEAVWWEASRDATETVWYRYQTAQGYLGEAAGRYRRPIESYDFREPIDVFDMHLYNKGSCVLWTLRHELGDKAFWGGVKAYLDANAHGVVHTRDFQRAMERHTGRNLDGFFYQWIHRAGHPVVEVKLGQDDGLVLVTVKQTQSGDDVEAVFRFQLRIGIVGRDGAEQQVDLPIAERERTFAIPTSGDVKTVRVDPGYRVLAEIRLKGREPWLVELVDDPCPVLAVRAAAALLDDGGAIGLAAVRRAALGHRFDKARGEMLQMLAKRGTAADRERCAEALRTDPSPRARRAAAEALGQFRGPEAADALIAALDADPETWHLHGALLHSLGKTRDPRARARLEAAVGIASWADHVKAKALAGLAELQAADVLPILLTASRTGSERGRGGAATALARLGKLVPDTRRTVVERLCEMLVEPGFRTQGITIGALGALGDEDATAALARVHRSAPDGRLRRLAYEALQRVRGGKGAAEGLNALRREVEALAETNAALRDRLDRLERHTG